MNSSHINKLSRDNINQDININLSKNDWGKLKSYITELSDTYATSNIDYINIIMSYKNWIKLQHYIINYEKSISQFPALYALIKPGNSDVKIGKTTQHPDILTNNSYNSRGNGEGYLLIGYWHGLLYYNFEQSILNHPLIKPHRIKNKNNNYSEWVTITLDVLKFVVNELTSKYFPVREYPTILKISNEFSLTDKIYDYKIYSPESNINNLILVDKHSNISNYVYESEDIVYQPLYTCYHKDYCEECNNYNEENITSYNCNECAVCIELRNADKKEKISKAKNIYMNNKYPKEYKYDTPDEKLSIKTIVNNNIINNTMNINNIIVKDLTINFIMTHDRYYEIMITQPDGLKDISQLKYVFIYLMCGIRGKDIFPDEKYSTAKTFNVDSALYSIKYSDDIPYLHGLIRYKTCNSSTTVTVNKLKNINKAVSPLKKTIIEVKSINLWQDEKHKYDVNDIKKVINNINESSSYGSTL